MAADIGRTISLVGTYTSTNNTNSPLALNGTFLFNQLVLPNEPLVKYHYIMEGCYRDISWPMVFQPFTWPWLFALAPLFVLCLATLNGQGWRDWRRLLVIVAFGCCSFAANKVFNMWIYDRGDVVSAIGATVVGILGTIYGHYSEGDALPSMIPGILILLPVKSKSAPHMFPNSLMFLSDRPAYLSLVALVQTFMILQARSQAGSAPVSRWSKARLRPYTTLLTDCSDNDFPVTIGITVGLFGSNLAITTFISVTHNLKGAPPRKAQVGSAF
jgi:hypothetical protein